MLRTLFILAVAGLAVIGFAALLSVAFGLLTGILSW